MSVNETNRPEAALALSALVWTLQDHGRADRLLALTGLTPDDLRARLDESALLAETLRFLESHEPDLIACAETLEVAPSELVAARRALERGTAMSRPLLVTDCDEVLLHMVRHFADWADEAHGLSFALDAPGFRNAVRNKATGEPVAEDRIWPLLDGFFATEMHRQNVVPGAAEALKAIGEVADIVILTNIGDDYHAGRVEQLECFGIRHRVLCNRGGKGRPVRELVEELRPGVAVFIDDLAVHHESVAKHAPEVWRLHMVAEPAMAVHMPPAPHAHVRIDEWSEAEAWILDRFAVGPALAA